MTVVHTEMPEEVSQSLLTKIAVGFLKFILLTLFCLTPVTALLALGWFTRKTANDIEARLSGGVLLRWPTLFASSDGRAKNFLRRWTGGFFANLTCGFKAWAAINLITLPVSLVWLGGWVAGWENSFNKGYENAGIWPVSSLVAVFVGSLVFALAPMAIAHQARVGKLMAITEVRPIMGLIRAAGFSYLWPTILIALGGIGVFGTRALPTFAEHISSDIAAGLPGAAEDFANQFKLITTMLLVFGLIVVRRGLARIYAHASARLDRGERGSLVKAVIVMISSAILWTGMIFLIYVAQFLNYAWWNWLNQPVLMLPWLGLS